MFVVRPVLKTDLDQLYDLSAMARAGLTTLPHDRDILKKRIYESVRHFAKHAQKPLGETYLFVMEDTTDGSIVGTCAIVSKIGGYEPSYTYELKTATKKSEALHVENKIQYLKLKRVHNGPSEVGTLFLNPHVRKKGLGRLLSLSRFLFIAQYPESFEKFVIAEMRGVLDGQDRSPFWNAVCKHFFEVDFKKADLMVMADKSFIADLIPRHPIYVPILPKEAQDVLGRVHKNTEPALKLLEHENFKFLNEIDIFEAGPVYGAKVKDIRTVKQSRLVTIKDVKENVDIKKVYLIANATKPSKFRVAMGPAREEDDGVIIDQSVATAIQAAKAEQIRILKVYDE